MIKRFLFYLFVEITLLGVVCYFFARWNDPISHSWVDTTHGTIGIVLLILPLINLIVAYISFSKHTNKYPKNSLSEHLFDPKTSQLGYQGSGNYVIELEEVDKGIWRTKNRQEEMKFDMRGYICPKTYICTYFIRNIHYAVINKNKYPLIKLFKSLKLYPFSKYQNVIISFCYRGKTLRKQIVVDNKTRVAWLVKLILRSKYYIDFMFMRSIGELRKEHVKMTEEKYKNGERR